MNNKIYRLIFLNENITRIWLTKEMQFFCKFDAEIS